MLKQPKKRLARCQNTSLTPSQIKNPLYMLKQPHTQNKASSLLNKSQIRFCLTCGSCIKLQTTYLKNIYSLFSRTCWMFVAELDKPHMTTTGLWHQQKATITFFTTHHVTHKLTDSDRNPRPKVCDSKQKKNTKFKCWILTLPPCVGSLLLCSDDPLLDFFG